MSDKEREPCPFCGSDNISDGEILECVGEGQYQSQSECMNCGACGPHAPLNAGEIDYGDVRAIAAWNTRAALDATPAEPSAVELTDEQIITIWDAWPSDIETGESALAFVHAVRAAEKGKA